MANLISYSFHSSTVRTIIENNEPLFCLADVCKTLDLHQVNKTASQIKEEFRCTELNSAHLKDALGRDQEATFITEPQLYFVMMRSRAKVAREFRQWVLNEVLPSIRKTGSYVSPSTATKDSDKRWWFEKEIRRELCKKVSEDGIARILDVALRCWKQGYAVACEKYDRELKQQQTQIEQQADKKANKGLYLTSKQAQKLRGLLGYFLPELIQAVTELNSVTTLIKHSRSLDDLDRLLFSLRCNASDLSGDIIA